MNKKEFYRFIERGALEGACRYFEYWYIYNHTPRGSRVLDIGAGRSALAQSLITKDCRVYATDIDRSAINYQVKNGVISELTDNLNSFGNYMFDVVVNASAIEHFDPENDGDIKAIEEVKRVLKPKGLFIIALPTGSKYIKSRKHTSTAPSEKVYSKEEFEKRFLNGFELIHSEFYIGTSKTPTDFIPHKTWNGLTNFEIANNFGDGIGLCAVLKKL